MNTNSANTFEAYVIENDGSRTAIPMDYANSAARTTANTPNATGSTTYHTTVFPGFVGFSATNASGANESSPYASQEGASAALRPGLHPFRRLAGLGLIAIGVPMLILPGPGLLAIVVGAALLLAP